MSTIGNWGTYFSILVFSWVLLCSLRTWDDEHLVELIAKDCGDTQVRCLLKFQEIISKLLEVSYLPKVLVAGKTGVGKTRLIKGFANDIPEINAENEKTLIAKTVKVEPYRCDYKDKRIIFYDSPGLMDTDTNIDERNHEYLSDMVDKNENPDAIVFFIHMNQDVANALDIEDEYVIRNISHTFGWARWRYAMFVLSFANSVHNPDAKHVGDPLDQDYFIKRLASMRLHIKTLLDRLFAGTNVVRYIPIIPAGLVNTEKLPVDVRDISWVDEFWNKLFGILEASRLDKTPNIEHYI